MVATPATTEAAVEKKQKRNKLPIAAGVVLLVGVNAGIWFYRAKTHHAPVRPAISHSSNEPALESIPLDPFVVNLAGDGGYLKAALTLSVRKGGFAATKGFDSESKDPAHSALVRDAILSTLSTQDAGALLTVEGKDALKKQLKANLNAKAPELALDNIYFTEFLVER